jgi:hypothetical protein
VTARRVRNKLFAGTSQKQDIAENRGNFLDVQGIGIKPPLGEIQDKYRQLFRKFIIRALHAGRDARCNWKALRRC